MIFFITTMRIWSVKGKDKETGGFQTSCIEDWLYQGT